MRDVEHSTALDVARAIARHDRKLSRVLSSEPALGPLPSGRGPSFPQRTVERFSSAPMSSSPLFRSALCQPRRCTFLRPSSPRTIKPDTLILGLSATSASRAITKFKMPAMSPTMTEGGIASWKKGEGDSFIAGDVLLEIVCPEQHHKLGATPMTCPRSYRKRTRQLST